MGAKSARAYNRNQARGLVMGLERIINRVNKRYTPYWLLKELDEANHKAQCILGEFERIMRGYNDSPEP